MQDFTHLHVHTQYSVLDGAAKIKDLVRKTKQSGMNALAITDHGNMFGVKEFVDHANKEGIKPIVGCEVYVAEGNRFLKSGKEDRSGYHLILLAKNEEGYKNLCRLNTLGYKKEAFYYTPRIDHELLEKYHENLIACSACLGGEIPRFILQGQEEKLKDSIEFHKKLFGEDYYFELQFHGHEDQKIVNARLLELSKEYGVKCIASNDVHFVDAEDKEAHQILICLNTGKKLSDASSMVYTGNEYLKTPEEMAVLFADHPELLSNTREIVDKIAPYKLNRDILLPHFPLPDTFENEMDYLRYIVYQGAEERWGKDYPEQYKERLDFELSTIQQMGFPGYFLIVWDFIKQARQMGVLVGPGRGSAAGSAIAYSIGITNVDPIKYNLLFERFLNPERISMPDVDIDFDDEGREKVIQYVVNKYGEERVAQIITFGTMAAKSSIKDVARVLELPLSESIRLAKMVPNTPGITLAEAFESEKALSMERNSDNPLIRKTLEYAVKLEGSTRNTGTHACGMIIAPDDLIDYVPLSTAKDTEMPVTQYEGSHVENVGLLKMDFLGLKTLSIIKGALDNIERRHNIQIDIDKIPIDDELTYQLFSQGDTNGIFQFESPGMKKYLKELKPNRIEDLVAMNALYRPGPMEYIPSFIKRKFGIEKIAYDLTGMEDILEETYGITVYQEQVMLLSQKLADFTKGDADTLRKAMGKKQKETLEKMKSKFMDGCAANHHSPIICEKIWKDWEAFASYAFNKSHATCYAYIAYQTAYLKAHYPAEFMASVLTNNLNDIEKISFFMDECKNLKIDLLSPDINESQSKFTVNKAGAIRFGLSAIKNVGEAVVENLIQERNENGIYVSVTDFVKRVNLRFLNKRCMESLVKAGAFDGFKEPNTRAAFFFQKPGTNTSFLDNLMLFASRSQQGNASAQSSLFEDSEDPSFIELEIPQALPWSCMEELAFEKEVTGFYLSGHPLDNYSFERQRFANCTLSMLKNNLSAYKDKNLVFCGVISASAKLISKNGNPYGRFSLADYDTDMEFVLFGEDYLNYQGFIQDNLFVMLNGTVKEKRLKDREPEWEVRISGIKLLSGIIDSQSRSVELRFDIKKIDAVFIDDIKQIIDKNIFTEAGKESDAHPSELIFKVKDSKTACILNMNSPKIKILASTFIRDIKNYDREIDLVLA